MRKRKNLAYKRMRKDRLIRFHRDKFVLFSVYPCDMRIDNTWFIELNCDYNKTNDRKVNVQC